MSESGNSPGQQKWYDLDTRKKTIITSLFAVAAVVLAVTSSIQYEAKYGSGAPTTQKPPPSYTGSAPLAITSTQQALESNNDLILVITPCADETVNTTVTNDVVTAADRIRSLDKIYVGVFTLPADTTLTYPRVLFRYPVDESSALAQVTLRSDITVDRIYNEYLSRKFLRD